MKEELLSNGSSSAAVMKKNESTSAADLNNLFGKKIRYKFWALAAILLLAFWSLFTGTVTLKSSTGNLNQFIGDIDSLVRDDFDILEVEDREKVVRHMWDVYTHSTTIRLPRFWQEAFEAGYKNLVSDVADVRNSAISEIAKMSMQSIVIEPPPVQSTSSRGTRKNPKSPRKLR